MQKSWILTALINFLIAALLGLLLRYQYVNTLDINFRFLTHAHSHVAMLGWIYLMLYSLITYYFVPEKKQVYTRLFWITQFAVTGMLLSFPFQGYAAISISFSTLHIFCSYYFVKLLWKDLQIEELSERLLVKTALLFMLISTIGVWSLGPAVATLGNQSAFYNIAIQFFLHFQFNGWFLFAVLAVLFKIFSLSGIKINEKDFKLFFRLLLAATILTFALPISWYVSHPVFIWINSFGILLQLVAAIIFIRLIKSQWSLFWSKTSGLAKLMFSFAFICLALKTGMQSTSLLPEVAELSSQIRNFVIGFIHLLMLGVISGFLLAYLFESKLVNLKSTWIKYGTGSFLLGFITTEILLFIQGGKFYYGSGLIPNYYTALFAFSGFLVIGILFIAVSVLRTPNPNTVAEDSL
ncbi:MAG: hypothetical protein ACQEWG_14170 [Bacteroidota bacterium]